MRKGVCPQCKVSPVIAAKPVGTMPRCSTCLDTNKQGRRHRTSQARIAGTRLSHNRADGTRYDAEPIKARPCEYCGLPYQPENRLHRTPHCPTCATKHAEEVHRRRLKHKKSNPYRSKANDARLVRRLKAFGVGIEWYRSQPQSCGICGASEPSGNGRWHIDHNHVTGKVRGLLCHHCNVGIGCLRDDPKILLAALRWISR